MLERIEDKSTDSNSTVWTSTGEKKGSLKLSIRMLQAASQRDPANTWKQNCFLKKEKTMTLSSMKTLIRAKVGGLLLFSIYPYPFLLLINQAFTQQPCTENLQCTSLFSKCWSQSSEQKKTWRPALLSVQFHGGRSTTNKITNPVSGSYSEETWNRRREKRIPGQETVPFRQREQGRPLKWGRWGKIWQRGKRSEEKTFRWGGVENILGKGTASAKFYFRGSDWATFASGRDWCVPVPKLVHFCYIYTAFFC